MAKIPFILQLTERTWYGMMTAGNVRRPPGVIPSAYWATVTHHATTQALVREAFADVHMGSHLVGTAHRADIRRLRELGDEKAATLGRTGASMGACRCICLVIS